MMLRFGLIMILWACLLVPAVAAERLLDPLGFNRSVELGAELDRSREEHVLKHGSLSPKLSGWLERSVLTSSLFAVEGVSGVRFRVRTDSIEHGQPVLWYALRYFDPHGTLFAQGEGFTHKASANSKELQLDLKQHSAEEVIYAELWMVKYEDLWSGGVQQPLPVYITDVRLLEQGIE